MTHKEAAWHLGTYSTTMGSGQTTDEQHNEAKRIAIKALEGQEPKTEWIPLTNRLPEEGDYCLCCDKDGYITLGYVSKWSKQWCFDDERVDMNVIAWMPLPEPYKEEKND